LDVSSPARKSTPSADLGCDEAARAAIVESRTVAIR
jgi:hypothetical protein